MKNIDEMKFDEVLDLIISGKLPDNFNRWDL